MKRTIAISSLAALLLVASPVLAQDMPSKTQEKPVVPQAEKTLEKSEGRAEKQKMRISKKNAKLDALKKTKAEYAATLKSANDVFVEASRQAAADYKLSMDAAKKNKSKDDARASREAFKESMKAARAAQREAIRFAKSVFAAAKNGELTPASTSTMDSTSTAPPTMQ